jgi:hypothetical protein
LKESGGRLISGFRPKGADGEEESSFEQASMPRPVNLRRARLKGFSRERRFSISPVPPKITRLLHYFESRRPPRTEFRQEIRGENRFSPSGIFLASLQSRAAHSPIVEDQYCLWPDQL